MRICLVSSSFYPATIFGGPISATWDLSNKLSDHDIKVYVSSTNANHPKRLDVNVNKFLKKGMNLYVKYYHEEIVNKFSSSFLFGIYNDIKQADLVYIQYIFHYTTLFSLLFSVYQNKKIIICPRGSLSSFTLINRLPIAKFLWLYLFIKPIFNKVIWHASSYLEKADILERFPKANVQIISDGIDFHSFQNSQYLNKRDLVEKFTNIRFEKVSSVFFSMGRLHKIKGFDVLIDAFFVYLEINKNAKLIIAGFDDGYGNILKQQILNYNLTQSIFLIGEVNFDEKKTLLSNCDCFVLASEFESFGIVVAEALSCGKPCVVSNKIPWKDLEKHNCGILANNDKISFANAFSSILNKNFDSKKIKSYVKSNYDWDVIVQRFLTIFKKYICIF